MENPNEIIKDLIKKYQDYIAKKRGMKIEIEANKPRYKIDSLFTGKIIYIESCGFFVGPNASIFDSGTRIKYKSVKKFAIFYREPFDSTYTHIGTNLNLETSLEGEPGEYVIDYDSIKEFKRSLQRFMIKNNLTKESKLSLNQIKEIEQIVNELKYHNQNKSELFW